MNSRRSQAIERGAGGAPLRAPSRIRPATRGDAPEIVDLLNACDVAEVGEPDSTLEDLENDWSMEGFDPGRDAWVAEGPAGLVGYAYAGDQFRTGELEADLWVHPDHHEPELRGRLLGLAERRAAQLAVERGYEDPRLDVYCIAGNRGKRDLLRRHGYELRRTVYRMTVDLSGGAPAAAVPDGLELRPFRLEADERTMHDVMTEAFEDHFRRSNEPFEAWKTRLLGHASFDPDLWWLAWDGDRGGRRAHRLRPRRPRLDPGARRAPAVAAPRPRRRPARARPRRLRGARTAARGPGRGRRGRDQAAAPVRARRHAGELGLRAVREAPGLRGRARRRESRGAAALSRSPLLAVRASPRTGRGRAGRAASAPAAASAARRSRSSSSMSALVRGENPACLRRSHHSSSGSRLNCAQRM